MAAPVVSVLPGKTGPYLPGEAFTAAVAAVDPDNSAETLVTVGRDSQNNEVTVHTVVERRDPFTITRAYWERTGEDLTVDGLQISGAVPSA